MGGMKIIGPTGRDQVYVPRGEPTFRKGNGAQGSGKGGGDTGAGVGGSFLSEVVGGNGGEAVGRSGGIGPVPPGPVLSQRDQPVSALRALVGLLDPVVGAQVRGLVEGLLSSRNQLLLLLRPPRMLKLLHACMGFMTLKLS